MLNKKLLSTFDAPIRFMYSKLPYSKELITLLIDKHKYGSDSDQLLDVFKTVNKILHKFKISIKNKSIIELGPGTSMINCLTFLSMGANEIYLIDKYPRFDNKQQTYERLLKDVELLQKKLPKLPKIKKFNNLFDNPKIQFINKDITETKGLQANFIYSINVLEHIKNIYQNIKHMSKIICQGGYMYHVIDLRDHYNFNQPFLFYKYSDHIWNKYLTKEGHSYTNRWRYHQFIETFQQNGFKILWQQKTKHPMPQNLKLDLKFKKMPKTSLVTTTLKILLQKK